MIVEILKSKIHRVRVTEVELNNTESIIIDEGLLDAANMVPNEKVQVVNINNGERFECYITAGERGTGIVSLNGGFARLAMAGDIIIIVSYIFLEFKDAVTYQPLLIFPDANNKLVSPG